LTGKGPLVKRAQPLQAGWMSEESPHSAAKPSREERLAAKLRENLKRRKQQARALDSGDSPAEDTLPKAPEGG
jgi:transposase InsO family protein